MGTSSGSRKLKDPLVKLTVVRVGDKSNDSAAKNGNLRTGRMSKELRSLSRSPLSKSGGSSKRKVSFVDEESQELRIARRVTASLKQEIGSLFAQSGSGVAAQAQEFDRLK